MAVLSMLSGQVLVASQNFKIAAMQQKKKDFQEGMAVRDSDCHHPITENCSIVYAL